MTKKLLCILLSVAMIFTVVGCGGSGDTSSGAADDQYLANKLELKETEQEKVFEAIKGTTMTKVGSEDDLGEYEKQVSQEFCDKYDITIEWVPMGYTEYVTKLPQMVAAGNPPDTGVMTDATALSFIYGNIAMPLNEYLDLDDEYWDMDVLNAFKVNGNYYAVNTAEIDTFFVYYNKTLFEEQALEDPYELYENGQWTWDKLRELAKKATLYESDNTTVKTYGIGTHYKEVFVLANGGNIVDLDDSGTKYISKLTSANTIAGLNFLKDLAADGSYDPNIAGFTEFPARQIAMFIERPQHAIGAYDLLNTMSDEIGIVPIPQGPNADKPYAASNLIANFVPANARNPLAGVAWAYFWTRRLVEGENEDNQAFKDRKYKMMSEEHDKVIKEYLAKATKVSSKLESLSGWGNYSSDFWADLVWNHKSAEEVSAKMENIVNTQLAKTSEQ